MCEPQLGGLGLVGHVIFEDRRGNDEGELRREDVIGGPDADIELNQDGGSELFAGGEGLVPEIVTALWVVCPERPC
jgi:hypothetical protein